MSEAGQLFAWTFGIGMTLYCAVMWMHTRPRKPRPYDWATDGE